MMINKIRKAMKCDLCGGKVEKKLVSYTIFHEGHWIIAENIPAKVCQQCGEKLFDPKVVERLQNIIWSKHVPCKKVRTPVFDFSLCSKFL